MPPITLRALTTRELPHTVAPRNIADVTVAGQRISTPYGPLSWNMVVTRADTTAA